MKIERKLRQRQSLAAFAEEYDLTLEIGECEPWAAPDYHASLRGLEVKDSQSSSCIGGAVGFGKTEATAIDDLIKNISRKWGVIDAFGPSRREFPVPIIVNDATNY